MVDRSASPYAGLRSTSVEKTKGEANQQHTPSMHSLVNIPFPRRAAASFNNRFSQRPPALTRG